MIKLQALSEAVEAVVGNQKPNGPSSAASDAAHEMPNGNPGIGTTQRRNKRRD
jgi:hypothetical protein